MGIVFILIVAVISVLAAILIWNIGAKSQQPRKLPNAEKPDVTTDWQSLSFTSGGSSIEGWLLQPVSTIGEKREGEKPVVIVAHGWGSNRTRVLRYARPLYEAGYAVFMYDARSHGDSEPIKAPSALMFRDDMLAAIAAAKNMPGLDAKRIAVLGHSLGGFGALLAVDHGAEVSVIVTDSMPVRFDTMLKAELRRKKMPIFPLAYLIPSIWLIRAGISRRQYREADIKAILQKHAGSRAAGKVPVLMVHSDGDHFIGSEDLKQLRSDLPEETMKTLFVQSSGHSASEQDPAFWSAVLPFLNANMK
ncbi:alpha/beta hydrolase [Paenibacillus harenae]|uniref:alpha/beta hydrolase n=1 Tax=Paenibacillus harenae TaxID=306543 RepID=UPI00278F3288|nr:alpha/beta fold hydrolase [Paenibacillus harenae]MDQ0060467.1 pimeloyl-ACP methyl ester carboxylesterase [Paenibacillus harenae]